MRPNTFKKVLRKAILNRRQVLVIGSPGSSKSACVAQVHKELKYDIENGIIPMPSWVPNPKGKVRLIYVHGVTADPTDQKGMPWVVVKEGEAEAIFVPFSYLKDLIETDDLVIVFLDDLGQATDLVQASFMQMIGPERRINGHILKAGVLFVGATNRRGDKAAVKGILEPLKGRFDFNVELENHWEDFCDWGQKEGGIDWHVLAYHRWCGTSDKTTNHLSRFEPTTEMTNSPTSRNWEHISNIVKDDYPKEVWRELFIGAIGETEGGSFHAFLGRINDLVFPDTIIASPDTAKIPDRPDIMWAVLMALAGRADKNNFSAINKYADRLSGEWSTVLIKESIRNHPELKRTGAYINWAAKNGEIQI